MRRPRVLSGPRTAVVLCLAIVLNLVLSLAAPAAATPVDLFNTPPVGWSISGPGSVPDTYYCSTAAVSCGNAFDVDDATYSSHSQEGGDGCGQVNPWHSLNASRCYWNGRFVRASGVTSFTINGFRFKYTVVANCCADTTIQGYALRVVPDGGGAAQDCIEVVAALSTGDISGSCDAPVTIVDGDHFELSLYDDWGGHATSRVYSFEAYTDLVTTVSISTYMVNMTVTHPAFQWAASWDWAQSWNGSFVVATADGAAAYYTKDSGGTELTAVTTYTSYFALGGSPQRPYFHQDCHPLCASNEFTVIINDTDRAQTATYTFLRSADGPVGPTTRPPRFVYIVPCFNLTANQCGHGSGVNELDLAWKWTGSNSKLQVGPSLPTGAFEAVVYEDDDETEGVYSQLGIPVNTAQSATWQARLTNHVGEVRLVTFRLPLATGGAGENYNSTDPRDSDSGGCAQADVPVVGGLLCGLREIWDVSSSDLRDKIGDTVGDCDQDYANCDGLVGTAMSRQPFNFIARSLSGVSGQLSRATTAFSQTDDCPGFAVSLDWTVWVPVAYRPTVAPLSFYMLRCEDFEPVVTSSWYSAIRTAMDPALFLGYAYMWVKRLQPKPVAAG